MNFFDSEKVKIIWEGIKVILILICIGCVVYFNVYFNKKEPINDVVKITDSSVSEVKENVKEEKVLKMITVDLKGAVKKEGVYTLEYGSNINDVIKLSGGLKNNGTLKNINLSKKLQDEMVIYVYTNNELNKLNVKEQEPQECTTNKIYVDDCKGSSVISSSGESKSDVNNNDSSLSNSKININTATLEELMKISGIGEAKAKAILEYRNLNGNFSKIEDILNVSGIGDSVYQKIKDSITV